MDILKHIEGRQKDIGGVVVHDNGAFLVSSFDGYDPQTGEPKVIDQGYLLEDIARMKIAAEDRAAKTAAEAAGLAALLAEMTALKE
jgi:hypothetical protein